MNKNPQPMDHYRFYNLVGQQVSTLVANSPWPTLSLRQAHHRMASRINHSRTSRSSWPNAPKTHPWRHESITHVPRSPRGQTHPKRMKTLFPLISDFWMLSSKNIFTYVLTNDCRKASQSRETFHGDPNQCTADNGEFLTIYRKCAPVLWTTMLICQWKYMSPIASLIGRCQMSRPRNFWCTAEDFRFRDPNIAQPVTQTDVLSRTKWIY